MIFFFQIKYPFFSLLHIKFNYTNIFIVFQVIYFYIGRAGNGRGTSTRTGWGASQNRNAATSRTAGREHRRQGKMRAGNHRETLLQRNDVVRNVLEMLLWRLASRLYAKDPARTRASVPDFSTWQDCPAGGTG